MGNLALMSTPAPGQVRVLRADGKVLDFEHPVQAIQVMQENPGHLLVKYCSSSKSDGCNKGTRDDSCLSTSSTFDQLKQWSLKNNVTMLRVDEVLDPRETYYLVPFKSKKEVTKSWNSVFREFLKSYGKAISNFEFEPFSGSEKTFSILKRSCSVPRSSRDSFRQEQQEQQEQLLLVEEQQQYKQQQQFKLQPKPSPSVSFPSRLKSNIQSIANPVLEGAGKCRELPPLRQTFQHKRNRRIKLRPALNYGWKPILESISEEVIDELSPGLSPEFSDDDSAEFHVNQSKCLRVHWHADQLHTIANLRPVEV